MDILDELKEYLVLDTDEFDTMLLRMLEVSEEAIKKYCRGGVDDVESIPLLRFAKVQYAAHLFLNRGVITQYQTYELPMGFKFLLNPYVKY